MLNYETSGSELIKVNSNPERSTADIIINEDWCIVVEVTSVLNGVVKGIKVWDSGETIFEAIMKYHGKSITPEDHELEIGQHVVFHRTGEFNNSGSNGFELHEEDIQKSSWACFIDNKEFIWVDDNGDGTGVYKGIILPLVTTDPLASFYNSSPPWKAGRRYLGQRWGNNYIVFLSGMGDLEKTFTQTAGEITWNIMTDATGKVLDFTAENV